MTDIGTIVLIWASLCDLRLTLRDNDVESRSSFEFSSESRAISCSNCC